MPLLPFSSFAGDDDTGAFAILMYHRVCESPSITFPPSYSVTPKRFRKQLSWLLDRGYQAWPLRRLVESKQAGKQVPPKTFAVTFDDGYANNLTTALPILQELNVPATVFVATGYLDSSEHYPFDDWMNTYRGPSSPSQWKPLTRAQCHQLLESEWVELGCHSHTHADFREHARCFREDLMHNFEILQREFGIDQPTFAYPYGSPELGFADETLADVARNSGCICALEIGNRRVLPDDDLFHWPRFNVASGDTGISLAAKISGCSEKLRDAWWRLRGQSQ